MTNYDAVDLFGDGTVRVESTSRGWAVFVYTGDGSSRARIATYTARYRALEHARALAGDNYDREGITT